jgi:FlaA1/EpsC-like NDP-sugar epimerase
VISPSPACVLTEELFYANEEMHPTSFEKITRTRSTVDGWSELQRHLDKLRASMSVDGAGPIRAKIKEIVPEYSDRSHRQANTARRL